MCFVEDGVSVNFHATGRCADRVVSALLGWFCFDDNDEEPDLPDEDSAASATKAAAKGSIEVCVTISPMAIRTFSEVLSDDPTSGQPSADGPKRYWTAGAETRVPDDHADAAAPHAGPCQGARDTTPYTGAPAQPEDGAKFDAMGDLLPDATNASTRPEGVPVDEPVEPDAAAARDSGGIASETTFGGPPAK